MPTIATRDTSATNRLIKKFVASSLKSTALNALSHLLSPNSTHHPQLYLLTLPLAQRRRKMVPLLAFSRSCKSGVTKEGGYLVHGN
ncbi:hypothetical protein POTOM_040982 [Populus tomentosa]|uniref:Uncharacterized protein n=1 Tax=Populus tomentosa TaxID=118781 RepID=A0A8X8CAS8_POPTO|nr:hypothetical protein POTOM_040982 [Populus tomentosa]